MEKRIQLLGIAVDIASTNDARELTVHYIDEGSGKVAYLVNSETLLLLQEKSDWKELVEESQQVLPGNANVNASIDTVLGYQRIPFCFEDYFDAILDYAIEVGYELLLVAQDEEKFNRIQENIREKRPFLTLSGTYLLEEETTFERVVNEINSVAPDILLVALEEKTQLEFLQQVKNQMTAGMMLCMGNILYNKVVSEAEVPESIQKLKIDNFYRWFQKDGAIKTFFTNLKVNLKLKKHNKDNQ